MNYLSCAWPRRYQRAYRGVSMEKRSLLVEREISFPRSRKKKAQEYPMFFENAAILSSVFLFNDHKQRDIRIVIFANSSVLTQYTDTRTLSPALFSFFLCSFISFLLRAWEQFMAYTKLFDWFSLNELFDTGTENIYRRVIRAEERQGCGSQGGKTYIKGEKRRRICSRRCILMLLNGFFCFTHTFVMFLSLPKALFALYCLIPRLFFIPSFFYLSFPPLPFFRRENAVRTLPSLARRTYSPFFFQIVNCSRFFFT